MTDKCTCTTPRAEYVRGCWGDCSCDLYRIDCRVAGYVCKTCGRPLAKLPKGVAK